jgi:hypothetical protein
MRTWVEKLVKAIEKEGIYVNGSVKVGDLEIYTNTNYSGKYISLDDHKCGTTLKIYEDEFDYISTSLNKCKQRAEDHFIEIINNL